MFKIKKGYRDQLEQILSKIETAEPSLKELTKQYRVSFSKRSLGNLIVNLMHPDAVRDHLIGRLRVDIFSFAFASAKTASLKCEQDGISMLHLARMNRDLRRSSDAAVRVSRNFERYVI